MGCPPRLSDACAATKATESSIPWTSDRHDRIGGNPMPGATPTPVVFIHGLWLHATSWNDWVELFREAGYAPIAPGWPGDSDTVEGTRQNPDAVAGKGIDDVVEHYAE